MIFDDRSGLIRHGGSQLLWRQVADDIAALIRSGRLPADSRLPTELELAERYGVSRPTIRSALDFLRRQGLVTVIHGRGTFVSPSQ